MSEVDAAVVEAEVVEETKLPAEVKQTAKRIQISTDDRGVLQPKTMDEYWRLADAYHRSGMYAKKFDSTAQIFTAMQLAAELGLRMQLALRQIAIIEGTPSIYGDLPLAVIKGKNVLEEFKEWWITDSGKEICEKNENIADEPFGSICTSVRNGNRIETWFTLKDARRAKLYPGVRRDGSPSPRSPWNTYTQLMLMYRARSINLKKQCSDILGGVAIAEYDFNRLPTHESKDVESEVMDEPAKSSQLMDLLNRKENRA